MTTPTVRLLGTGGTIASRAGAAGRSASVRADELLAAVRGRPGDFQVTAEDLGTRGSFSFDTGDLLAIARAVRAALAEDVAGVVVTHGTDVMEESAFLVELTHADPRPVVFTGAQRPFDDPAPDGPANLTDALLVAAAPQARGLGVLVVFDGVAWPARGLAKADTLRAGAFGAPGRGPLLRVADGRVLPLASPARAVPLLLDLGSSALPRVDVFTMYVGADPALLHAAVAAGARGIVLAGYGAGNASPAVVAEVAALTCAGVPVLVCSRVPAGPVAPLYTGGGGADLARAGAVFGADLSPWQGRLLLAAALAVEPADAETVVRTWLGDPPRKDRHEQGDLRGLRRGRRRGRRLVGLLRW